MARINYYMLKGLYVFVFLFFIAITIVKDFSEIALYTLLVYIGILSLCELISLSYSLFHSTEVMIGKYIKGKVLFMQGRLRHGWFCLVKIESEEKKSWYSIDRDRLKRIEDRNYYQFIVLGDKIISVHELDEQVDLFGYDE